MFSLLDSNQEIDDEEWKQRSDKRSKARSLSELFFICVRKGRGRVLVLHCCVQLL